MKLLSSTALHPKIFLISFRQGKEQKEVKVEVEMTNLGTQKVIPIREAPLAFFWESDSANSSSKLGSEWA